jgi:UDP-N-acetylglucosamine 3-dehydrogenase
MTTEPSRPLVAAILGAGNMGARLGKALSQIAGVSISYVYSRQLARAQGLAQDFHAVAVDQVEPIFADPRVDAVIVCLPTFTRTQILKAAVESERHIFCEKPLALNPAMAREITLILDGYSRCVMVGHVLRFFWEYIQLREKVLSGEIGTVGTVRLSRCVGYPGRDSWFSNSSKSGGIILDLLVHDIDFLLWTFGDVAQVFAQSLFGEPAGSLDYALLNIQMQSGALAHIEGSWAHPVGSFRQTVEISGSQGLLDFDNQLAPDFRWTPTREPGQSPSSRISLPEVGARSDPYFAEISCFVEYIRNQKAPGVSWREALKACEVAFLAIESAKLRLPMLYRH